MSVFIFSHAQRDVIRTIGDRAGSIGNTGTGSGGLDSFVKRNRFEDSITITYRYLDSTRSNQLDTTIGDYTTRFPIPATHVHLGNLGTATRSILFTPNLSVGWNPGFHALDVYKWKVEDVKFYNTTRPYTELGYTLGSQSQQIIEIIHTQNIRPHWNAAIQYRLVNSPGFFKSQRSNHNNYLFSSWYNSPNKRYNNYVILVANRLQVEENGGIRTDKNYLNDPFYNERFRIPTKLGVDAAFGANFFSNTIKTGNEYKNFNALIRQQYDIGKKDSIVTDTTVIPLFYPRLRFEHTFQYGNYDYRFIDFSADSSYYANFYSQTLQSSIDTAFFNDQWKEIRNEFSIYQFPDTKNLQQFIKAGIEHQFLKAFVNNNDEKFYNIIARGEYRNRTKNGKWNIGALGKLYLNGYNAGDYHAYVNLQRLSASKIGNLQIGFQNINRSPSFIYDERSSFYLDEPKSFSKENIVHFFAAAEQPQLKLKVGADYFAVTNYLYITDFYKLQQEKTLFNVLRINALKTFRIRKNINLHSEIYLQQKAGNAQVNIPLFFTRNRLAFEGNFYRNLHLSTGFEIRYHTPYKADNYSPVLGQFFFQDNVSINNLPDVAAFVNFRIRSFKAYFRAENLNALRFGDGVSFSNDNLAAPDYPYPGLVIRFGVYWSFIN